MNVDNHGFVIQPEKYQMWSAELTGNTDDTGGIYVFLFAPDNKKHSISFWNTNMNGVLQQLEEEEQICICKNAVFWSFDRKNYAKSNWWKKTASTGIGEMITIRTANTLKKKAGM